MLKLKKVMMSFSLLIVSIVFLSSTSNVSAKQSDAIDSKDEIISFDKYYSTLQAEYAKYDIKYEILEKNDSVVLTNSLLNEQLIIAKKQGEANKQKNDIMNKQYEMYFKQNNNEKNYNNDNDIIIHPMIM